MAANDPGQQQLEDAQAENHADNPHAITNPAQHTPPVEFDDIDDGIGGAQLDEFGREMPAPERSAQEIMDQAGIPDGQAPPQGRPEANRPLDQATHEEEPWTPPPAVEPPAGEVQPPQPRGPQFDEGLLEMAGMSADQAAGIFQNDEQLRAAVAWQDHQAMQAWEQTQAAQRAQTQPQVPQQFVQQPVAQPTQYVPQQPPQPQQPEAQDEFDPDKLDPEEWGPETVKLMKTLKSSFDAKFAAQAAEANELRQALTATVQGQQQHAKAAEHDRFDAAVNQLPEQFKEMFGTGDRHTLQGTQQFQNRVRLNQAMQKIRAGRSQMNFPSIGEHALMQRALQTEFSNQTQQANNEQVAAQVTRRFNQATTPPSSRQASQLTPEERAAARVSKVFAAKGVPLAAGHEDIVDGI